MSKIRKSDGFFVPNRSKDGEESNRHGKMRLNMDSDDEDLDHGMEDEEDEEGDGQMNGTSDPCNLFMFKTFRTK